MSGKTKAQIELENIELRSRIADLEKNNEVEALKKKVVETAQRYAEDHGWCGVVNEALAEMGLLKSQRKMKFTFPLEVSWEFTFNVQVFNDYSGEWPDDDDMIESVREELADMFGIYGSVGKEFAEAVKENLGDHADAHSSPQIEIGEVEVVILD